MMGKAPQIFLIICFFFTAELCRAQSSAKVSDPILSMKENIITISYDILNSDQTDKFIISVEITDAEGRKLNSTAVSGDIGNEVAGGNDKRIYWDLEADSIFMNASIFVEVIARLIPPPETVAGFSANKVRTGLLEPISFTNASEHAESYAWNFGDGNTSTEENPTHSYSTSGSFEVSLVANGKGGSHSASRIIMIDYPIPIASFVEDKSSALAGEPVMFRNNSEHASSFLWNFGDGETSKVEDPIHAFNTAGIYSVELTATGEGGSNVLTRNLLITEPSRTDIEGDSSESASDDEERPLTDIPAEYLAKEYSRSAIILQSLAIPGLGLSKISGMPHWVRGVAGYGCIIGAVILNRQAINTFDGIDDYSDFNDRSEQYEKSIRQDNISEVLAYTAIGIWVSDVIWTLVGSSDLRKRPFSAEARGISLRSSLDPHSYAPLIEITYRF